MKEEKVGQANEELEIIDFDLTAKIEMPTKTDLEETFNEVNETLTNEDQNVIEEQPVSEVEENYEEVSTETPVEETTPIDSEPETVNDNIQNEVIPKKDLFTKMQDFVDGFTEPAPIEPSASFGEIFDKVNKEKNVGRKIKILLTEKRSKSLLGLIFWIVFMVVVISILKGGMQIMDEEPETPVVESSITALSNLDNYGYTITLLTDSDTVIIDGKYFENKSIFTLKDESYYYENGVVSLIKDNESTPIDLNLEIELDKLSPSSIAEILEMSEVKENTTDTDGTITARTYIVPATKLISYLYGETVDSEKEVIISVRYENNKVSYFEINMSDITDLEPAEKIVSEIAITYKGIGTITIDDVTYDVQTPIEEEPNNDSDLNLDASTTEE